MKSKKILACLIAAFMLLALLAGCGGSPNADQGAAGGGGGGDASTGGGDTSTGGGNTSSGGGNTSSGGRSSNTPSGGGSSNTPAPSNPPPPGEPDYNNMTLQELYELAVQETGMITVYSTTKDTQKALENLVKEYPEFEGRVEYIANDTNKVADRIITEVDTKNYYADVLQVKDNSGSIYHELVLEGYLDIYYPAIVCDHIDPSYLTYGMPMDQTFSPWYYNPSMYPDGCPLTSWWDIVEGYNVDTKSYKDASGNNTQFWTIFSKDITSESYSGLWSQLIVDGDLLAAQYEKQYGRPLEYTYHDKLNNAPGIMEFPENNGGIELFWRFSQMLITELDGGDEVVAAVDASLNGPTLGLTSAGKIRNSEDGLSLDWVTGLQPYTAFAACHYFYVVKGTDNPAGARFVILYILGGDDGWGMGNDPFKAVGAWSIRDDVVFDANPHTLAEVNVKGPDFEEIYSTFPNTQAYWLYWSNLR